MVMFLDDGLLSSLAEFTHLHQLNNSLHTSVNDVSDGNRQKSGWKVILTLPSIQFARLRLQVVTEPSHLR